MSVIKAYPKRTAQPRDAEIVTATDVTVGSDPKTGLDVVVLQSALPTGGATLAEQQAQTVILQQIEDNTDGVEGTLTTINSHYTASTSTVSRVNASVSSVQLVALNASRKAIYLYNESVGTAYVKLGTTAATNDYTLQMAPRTFTTLNFDPIYTGRIDAIWSVANGAMQVTELT